MTQRSRLAGRRALVTGASSGIGAATARALAERGMLVAVTGRDDTALRRVAAASGCGPTLPADLTQPGAPASVVEEAAEALGGLDTVVSNAGAGWSGPFAEVDPALIETLVGLNVTATALLARAAVPELLRSECGHLVFVGSIAGSIGIAGEAVYSATKFAVAGLADALRQELASDGVAVSLVTPGVVDTEFFTRRGQPYRRLRPRPIPPSRVAEAIVECLERGRPEAVVPRWLAVPARLHGSLPGVYRSLARRFG